MFSFGQTTTAAPTASLFAMPVSTTTGAADPKPGFTLGGQVMSTPSAGGQPGSLGFTPGASLQSKPAGFATPTPQTNTGGFTLGQPLTTSTPGFTFGQTTAASAATSATTAGTTAPGGLVLGTTPVATPAGSVMFGGGATTGKASTTPAVSAAKTTAAAATTATAPQLPAGLNFGAAATTAATTSAAKPTAALSFGTTATTVAGGATAAGLLQGVAAVKPTANTTSFSLTGAQTSAPAASTAAATTAASATKGPTMTFTQLEEKINKWSVQLEETERTFLHQATQVNAWDRQVIENGEKIVALNEAVQRVKLDQGRLDHELDFILAQQRELEDMLLPLEGAVKSQAPSIYQQHADLEREHTYQLAENTDAQLKRMMQDIKDIIEHLNQSGAPNTSNDPLHQIARILNAHMDSLQWLDQNAAVLQRKVDEVAKQCEVQRKEQEHSFRLAFE
ncbi:nuclear pore glycoprotein p62-like isoform X1 [Branchiostoma floridae]|uniref:Nuclear pore glycoprotein p62-like isoform X1 n=1 Tax=Branchiostoma floridae TaxID=7739 RepID=A0A9J7MXS4_BRAFL|nr:nuclear pore glycoprotein p62-like isoform X1 [Branchiostoma floridae]